MVRAQAEAARGCKRGLRRSFGGKVEKERGMGGEGVGGTIGGGGPDGSGLG